MLSGEVEKFEEHVVGMAMTGIVQVQGECREAFAG